MANAATAAPAGKEGNEDKERNAVRVLFTRNFGPYFLGNLLSNCGTWFQSIALSLLVYRLTESTLLVGLVNFAQFAGVILLAPWSGGAADRFDRRRLLIVTQLLAMTGAFALAAFAAAGLTTVPLVIVMAFLMGFTTAFSSPAQQAIVPSLVRKDDLGAAVAMTSVTFNLSRVIGPTLGALVVNTLGIAWAFAFNGLSYVALIVALLIIHPAAQTKRAVGRASLRESIGIVRRDKRLVLLLVVVGSVSFALDPVTTLSPAYAQQVFRQPDTLVGFLLAAFGIGAVTAAVLASGKTATPYRRIAVMLSLCSLGTVAFALVPVLPLAVIALLVTGFGYLAGHTRANALLQLSVPDEQRGRVMALWSVCFLGGRPVASLLDGAISTVAGIHVATILMAIPTAIAAYAMLTLHRDGATVGVKDETEAAVGRA